MDHVKATWQGLDDGFLGQPTGLAIALTIFVVLLTTRLITGGSTSHGNGKSTPPLAPYWMPYFGHVPRIVVSVALSLDRFRSRFPKGIFSIRLFSHVHTFVFRPDLVASLLKNPGSAADEQYIVRRLMVTNFGLPSKDLDAYDKAATEIQKENGQLLNEAVQGDMVNNIIRGLKEQVADLVSFNSYSVDQMDWERLANAELIEDNDSDERVMEADLIELVRNFVVKPSTAAIFGTNVVDNFPEIWPFLWALDESFTTLALDIPLWVPWPRAQRARTALRQLLGFLEEFHEALDKSLSGEEPGPKWQDLDNVSALVQARTVVFRKHGLSLRARAAWDVGLLWSVNATSASLISWALLELYQDRVLLEQVREETAPYVRIVEPTNDFGGGIWVPPTVETLDVEALMTKCPLLTGTYVESLRLYGGGWAVRKIKEDVELKGTDGSTETFLLKKGTFAHVVHSLHNTDPRAFPEANDWQVRRHVKESTDEKGALLLNPDSESVKAYDGGLTLCDDSSITLKKMLIFTSVLISMYEIEPARGKGWPSHGVSKGAVSSWPSAPIRVWVKRKPLVTKG